MTNTIITPTLSRRDALKGFGLAGAAFSILPTSLRGATAPSKRVNIGMIGVGRQGYNANMRTFLGMQNVRVVAVNDVDELRLQYAKQAVDEKYGNGDCKAFTDFRELLELEDLDAVMISTPDHWHAIPALAAMKKGLHVCIEKAMTRYFGEGRAIADMAKRTGVVCRLDSECRSNAYMQRTANLVLNGYIGNVKRIEVGVPHEFQKSAGNPAVVPVPDYLDYEMWQGPAPLRPYSVDRVHSTNPKTGAWQGRPGWLRLEEYCSGMICNWGGHLMDVANQCNGTSYTGPVSVEGSGTFQNEPGGLWNSIIDFEMQYKYANGVVLDYTIEMPYLRIEGDEGWIQAHWHSKGGLKAHDMNIFRTKFKDTDVMVPKRSDKQDFISAITEGTEVMIDAEAGHRVNSQCLLGLACAKAGERLEWDPKSEKVTNSAKGEELMKHSFHRDPWKLEKFV